MVKIEVGGSYFFKKEYMKLGKGSEVEGVVGRMGVNMIKIYAYIKFTKD